MAVDSFRYKNPFDITTAGFSDNGELLVQGDFSYVNKKTNQDNQSNQNEQGIQGIQGTQGIQDVQNTEGMQSIQGIQETQEDSVIRVASISEAKSIFNQSTNPSSLEFIIDNLAFVFRSRRFMFVKDDSGGLLIYDYSTPVITTCYNEGDLIGSIQGKLTLYRGTFEFLPTKNSPDTTGVPIKIEPIPTTINDIENNYEQYESQLVTLNNVVFVDGGEYSNGGILYVNQNEKTFQCWDRFGELSMTIQPNAHVNITGFIGFSDKWGYHIWPRSNNDIEII